MRQRQERLFFNLSLLMVFLSFVTMTFILVVVFYLTFSNAFICNAGPIAGVCIITDDYSSYNYIIMAGVGLIAAFLILASYFQQYFLPESEKPVKVEKPKKEKPKYTRIMRQKNIEVYEAPEDVVQTQVPKKITSKHVKHVATPIGMPQPEDKPKDEPLVEEKPSEETIPKVSEEAKIIAKQVEAPSDQEKPTKKIKRDKKETTQEKTPDELTAIEPPSSEAKPLSKRQQKRLRKMEEKLQKQGVTTYEKMPITDAATEDKPDETMKEDKPPVDTKEPERVVDEATVIDETETALDKPETVSETPPVSEATAEEPVKADTQEPPLPSEAPVETQKISKKQQRRLEKKAEKLRKKGLETYVAPVPVPSEPLDEKTAEETKPATKSLLSKTEKRRTKSHTKEDMSLVLAEVTELDRDQALLFIQTMIDVITEELVAHRKVSLHQFGTFLTSELKARKMNVPTKDGETEIKAHHVVRFKSSPTLTSNLNDPEAKPTAHLRTLMTPPPDVEPVSKEEKPKKKTAPKRIVTAAKNAKSVTKADIILAVTELTKLEAKSAETFVNTFLDVITETLAKNESVSMQPFGVFSTRKMKAKTMKVPTKDKPVEVEARHAVKFKAGKAFSDADNSE